MDCDSENDMSFDAKTCRDRAIELIENLNSPSSTDVDPSSFLQLCKLDDTKITDAEILIPNLCETMAKMVRDFERDQSLRKFTGAWMRLPQYQSLREHVVELIDKELTELGHMNKRVLRSGVLHKVSHCSFSLEFFVSSTYI